MQQLRAARIRHKLSQIIDVLFTPSAWTNSNKRPLAQEQLWRQPAKNARRAASDDVAAPVANLKTSR